MSIWTCDDYTIEKVYVKTTTQGTEAGSMKSYAVDVQRLPTTTYPNETVVSIDYGVIPADTADDALLALIIPQCNTELANINSANDADSFDYSGIGFTEKTGL